MTDRNLILVGGAHVHTDDHLRVLAGEGWRVSHVHDREADRAARYRDRLGARALDDIADLAGASARGVVVCSETVHHEADICAALGAGLPVFSEKPLAGSAAAAARIATRAEDAGTLLHTGYFLRTNDALARIRTLVSAGAIGRPHHARMRFSHDGGFADWLDLDAWMTDPEAACYDGFVDEAVHCIDFLQCLMGPATDGAARTGNALGWPVDDHGAAVLSFARGATGVVEAGLTDMGMRLELDLIGAEGGIGLVDGIVTVTVRGEGAPADTFPLSPLDAGEGIRPFLRALDGEEPAGLVTPREAASVNALLDAMGLNLRHGGAA
jgi:predicted dehydrogenase